MLTKLDKIAENVVKLLIEKKSVLSTAESCTGGLISEKITAVSGSSSVFGFGVCSYANEAKIKLLGVSEEILSSVGAVSEETAVAMASGIKRVSGSDFSISVTGIAGPTGAVEGKPVGTVYIGIAAPDKTYAKRFLFTGESFPEEESKRSAIRAEAAYTALSLIKEEIEEL